MYTGLQKWNEIISKDTQTLHKYDFNIMDMTGLKVLLPIFWFKNLDSIDFISELILELNLPSLPDGQCDVLSQHLINYLNCLWFGWLI